jgi:hypothetical protein
MKALSPLVAIPLALLANVAPAHAEYLEVDLYADRAEGAGRTSYYVQGYTDVNTGDWGVYIDIFKYDNPGGDTEYWRCEGPGLALGITPEVGYARIYSDDSQPPALCYNFNDGSQTQLYDLYIDFLRGDNLYDDPWFSEYQMSAHGYIRFEGRVTAFDRNGTDYDAYGYVIR